MNELLKVEVNENQEQTVSGRELHMFLGIETRYNDWFARMLQYGFEEGKDFYSKMSKNTEAGRPSTDHIMKLDMAKELCMIQRTEIGKRCREYFLCIEQQWNSPEAVMARALQFANQRLELIMEQNSQLLEKSAVQEKLIVSYCDIVLNCKELVTVNSIAKDYGKSAVWLNKWLHEHGIQYKQGEVWLLYQKYADKGYVKSKTTTFIETDGGQHAKSHTYWTQRGRIFLYELLKENGILPLIEQNHDEA